MQTISRRFACCVSLALVPMLGGCGGNSIIHPCPDVRNENPSLLQGRTVQTGWNETPAPAVPCDAPPVGAVGR